MRITCTHFIPPSSKTVKRCDRISEWVNSLQTHSGVCWLRRSLVLDQQESSKPIYFTTENFIPDCTHVCIHAYACLYYMHILLARGASPPSDLNGRFFYIYICVCVCVCVCVMGTVHTVMLYVVLILCVHSPARQQCVAFH